MNRGPELLSHVPIFEGLSPTALEQLAATLRSVAFTKDARIVGQDEKGDALFIIEDGRVKVTLARESGREVILSILRSGEFFGEMSLLDGQPRSASVVALEDARMLVLSREAFVHFMEENPAIALNILGEMSRRLRRADEVIGNLALLDVYARLGRVLVELARREGESLDEGVLVRGRPTQQDLAAMVGTSRETVSRVLSEFQRRGLLSMQGKSLLLSHGFIEQPLAAQAEES